jgi:uncharacterized membrane protein
MQLSDLTLRVLLLFFPGVICCKLVDNLTVHQERTTPIFFVHSFILGISCYLLLSVLAWVAIQTNAVFDRKLEFDVVFFDALTNTRATLRWPEILMAAALSFPVAFVVSFFTEKKLIHRLAKRIGVTKKFGDLDVWDFMLNSKEVEWVVVRDLSNDLMFEGWVRSFSDIGDVRELLLRDVRVYRNSTGERQYEVGGLYISRKRDDITIELASLGYSI